MNTRSKIAVLYNDNNTYCEWETNYIDGWDMSGGAFNMGGEYPHMMEFAGPSISKGEMHAFLGTLFQNLVIDGHIKKYKFDDDYLI